MANVNINNCTTRHLIGLPGISRSLAESIIRYRNENNGLKKLDELLRLPGMTQSKCRILARKFSASKPLVLGISNRKSYSKISVAQTSFMCQGQSVGSKNNENVVSNNPKLQSTQSTGNPDVSKQGASIKKEDTEHIQYSENRLSGILNRNTINLYPSLKPCVMHVEKLCQDQKEEKYKSKTRAWEPAKSIGPWVSRGTSGNVGVAESSNQPSVTLQASASGNNINFSCTINKRLFSNSGPEHTHNLQPQKWTLFNTDYAGANAAHGEVEEDQPVAKKRPPSEGIGSSKASSEDGADDPMTNMNHYKVSSSPQVPASTKTSCSSKTVSSSVALNMLSMENMLIFDRQTRMNGKEKRNYIECWVAEVNRVAQQEEHQNWRYRKDSERRLSQKVRRNYISICAGAATQQSYRRRSKPAGEHDSSQMPAMFRTSETTYSKMNASQQSPIGKNKSDSNKVCDNSFKQNTSSHFDVISENDCGQREMNVILENCHILQKRVAKSGNLSGRAALVEQLEKEILSQPSKSMQEPIKQIKQLVNNYVMPRYKKANN